MYKAYLISLNNPTKKIEYLKENNVYPILVKGVNGKILEEEEIINKVSSLYKNFGPKSAIGCALSHINTWKNFIENTDDDYAIIFEDDVLLEKEFTKKLDIVMNNVPKDFDLLYIGCFGCDKTKNNFNLFEFLCGLVGLTSKSKKINKYISIPTTAFALHSYIISRKGAKKLIENLEGKINNHLDFCIQELSAKNKIKTYVSIPRLAYQTSTDDISSENVSSSHPILINRALSNLYVDKMVRANYLTSMSIARVGHVNINFFSIIFLILGFLFSFMGLNIKHASLFYLVISIADIFIAKDKNDILILLFHYMLLIFPIVMFRLKLNKDL